MDGDFSVESVDAAAKAVFDCTQAKLLFEADVFWARHSIGEEILRTWLETYQRVRDKKVVGSRSRTGRDDFLSAF